MTPNSMIKQLLEPKKIEFSRQNEDCFKNAASIVNLPVSQQLSQHFKFLVFAAFL